MIESKRINLVVFKTLKKVCKIVEIENERESDQDDEYKTNSESK